jgi:Glycosyl transferase 4-like domain
MARFLITMLPANDLGLPTRMVPIARALADRGHEVAVFNPAPAPSRLIAEAGLTNLPMPARPMPAPAFDLTMVAEGWDVEHFFAGLYTSEEYVRDATAVYVDLVRDYAPDMVVDSFEPIACLAARIAKVPLATVLQGNIHPASRGFTWWKDERPAGLPSAAAPSVRRVGRRKAYRRGRARPRSEMIQKSAATSRKIRLATPAITRITWNLIQRSRSCRQFPGNVEGVHVTIC